MKEWRDAILERLDVGAFYARQGIELGTKVGTNEYRISCPIPGHPDANASANVNVVSGLWYCHTCQRGGNPIDLLMLHGAHLGDALAELAEVTGVPRPSRNGASHSNGTKPAPRKAAAPKPEYKAKLPTEEQVDEWHRRLMASTDMLRWMHEHRGYSDETLAEWKLGWDGDRLTIPIRDESNELVNVRRRRDPRQPDEDKGKMLGFAGNNTARLWPLDALRFDEVLLLEGEFDTILMRQQGFPNALTVTSGAGIFNPDWAELFAGKTVSICYDNDDAGRRGAQRVAAILAAASKVKIVLIPGLPEHGDVTDFFVEQGRRVEELADVVADADQYLLVVTKTEEGEPTAAPLYEASDAGHRGKRLRIPVMVSGKAMQPYEVPFQFKITCDLSNRKYCPICPLNQHGGKREIELSASDPKVLGLFNVTEAQQKQALKELAGAVTVCQRPQIEVVKAINVEEIRLIPELDTRTDGGESEYVSRTGYLLAHGLRTNRSYEVIGYAHPHPKTQGVVHLLSEAIPAQDNVSAFAVTPAIADSLAVFQGDPGEVFSRVYEDFRLNVHRIQGRPEMQAAYDLVWHSVIAFTFNGAFVRRGWAECMVMGDSGQAKTEMSLDLLRHYGLGERVQAEQASLSGLIGGLEKMGDSWILSWGRVPLNDKRLLIIDETQGLKNGQVEAMSDVRATGVAEIVKIRTERTNARCRLIWLANPPSGRPLSQHNQGVLAIRELFEKPEDVRRLDFAITVASGDVDYAKLINVRLGEPGSSAYSSEACRALILWAWSRRPDQIHFEAAATDAILAAATELATTFHPSIPLVEPADQRLKLARLSAAAAARCFSTPDGENLWIKPEHVAFVVDYLRRIYCATSMAYDEYSTQRRRGEELSEEETYAAKNEILNWSSARIATDFLRQATVFKKSELVDVVGFDDHEAKRVLKWLASMRLIRTTREGYVKNPAFIVLLRDLVVVDETPVPPSDAPFG